MPTFRATPLLAEITSLLIEKLSAPFPFVELEGDAVFVFAPDVAVEDSERLVDIMEVCYAGFRIRLEQMSINTSCECTACKAIPALDLKFVAHYGLYLPQKTPTGTKLVGADVIAVHRLLKNEVIARTGIRAYALLTDAFAGRARRHAVCWYDPDVIVPPIWLDESGHPRSAATRSAGWWPIRRAPRLPSGSYTRHALGRASGAITSRFTPTAARR